MARDLRQGCAQRDVRAQRDGVGRGAGAFIRIRQGDAFGQFISGRDRPGGQMGVTSTRRLCNHPRC